MAHQTSMFDDSPPVNKSVAASDAKRLGGQSEVCYGALKKGPTTTSQFLDLVHNGKRIVNVTARISEIRAHLRKRGLTVLALHLVDGLWLYKIGPNEIKNGKEKTRLDIPVSTGENHHFWQCPRCSCKCNRPRAETTPSKIKSKPLCLQCCKDLRIDHH